MPKSSRRPPGYRELRIVTIVLGIVVMLFIGSAAYSAYADYQSLTGAASTKGHLVTVQKITNGPAETVKVKATIQNGGLYALNVTMACSGVVPSGVSCSPGSVFVGPGQKATLNFSFTVSDVAAWVAAGAPRINGTVTGELVPLSSISVEFDLGSLASQGGS